MDASYDQKDAADFIDIFGSPLKVKALTQRRPFTAGGAGGERARSPRFLIISYGTESVGDLSLVNRTFQEDSDR
jgi:hypothetical protein